MVVPESRLGPEDGYLICKGIKLIALKVRQNIKSTIASTICNQSHLIRLQVFSQGVSGGGSIKPVMNASPYFILNGQTMFMPRAD